MRAVQVTEFGGPEVLTPVELPDPVAGPGEVLIDVDRIGVNYADTHQAENSYLAPSKLPLVPGGEVVGRAKGAKVVALLNGGGGYAEKAVAPEATASNTSRWRYGPLGFAAASRAFAGSASRPTPSSSSSASSRATSRPS